MITGRFLEAAHARWRAARSGRSGQGETRIFHQPERFLKIVWAVQPKPSEATPLPQILPPLPRACLARPLLMRGTAGSAPRRRSQPCRGSSSSLQASWHREFAAMLPPLAPPPLLWRRLLPGVSAGATSSGTSARSTAVRACPRARSSSSWPAPRARPAPSNPHDVRPRWLRREELPYEFAGRAESTSSSLCRPPAAAAAVIPP